MKNSPLGIIFVNLSGSGDAVAVCSLDAERNKAFDIGKWLHSLLKLLVNSGHSVLVIGIGDFWSNQRLNFMML